MKQITKKEFFLLAYKHNLYKKRVFLLRVSNVLFKKDKPDEFPTNVDNKSFQFVLENETYEIIDSDINKPLFDRMETLVLEKGDLPNVVEKTKTTYRKALLNVILIVNIFNDEVPYISGSMDNKVLSDIVETKLRDKTMNMKQYFKLSSCISFIEVLADSAVVSSTDQALGSFPTVKKLKDELVLKYKDKLDDPVVVAKINKELIAEIRNVLKDSPAFKYLDNKALIGKSVLMTHGMVGGVQRLDDPTKVYTVTNSLIEGMRPEDLPSVINNLRAGSIDRGEETALGGAAAKGSGRVYQNTKIVIPDCGTKVGEPFEIDGVINKDLVGYYEPGKSKPMDLDYINKHNGRILYVRMPIGCTTPNGNYCEKCMGDSVVASTTALGPYMSAYSNVYMQISLAQFHGKVLKTRQYTFGEFCS